jgi:hypothetical protein
VSSACLTGFCLIGRSSLEYSGIHLIKVNTLLSFSLFKSVSSEAVDGEEEVALLALLPSYFCLPAEVLLIRLALSYFDSSKFCREFSLLALFVGALFDFSRIASWALAVPFEKVCSLRGLYTKPAGV